MPAWKKGKKPLYSTAKYIKQMSKFKNSVVIVDTRSAASVKAGHIPGTTAIPAAELGAAKDKFSIKKTAPVIVVADDNASAMESFAVIRNLGFKNATILQGGFTAYQKGDNPVVTDSVSTEIVYVPKPIPGALKIAAFEKLLAQKESDTVILDVRTDEEVEAGTIQGAMHIPTEEVGERVAEIPKGKKVVAFCSTGVRAEMAYLALKEKGIEAKFLKAKTEFSPEGKVTISEN